MPEVQYGDTIVSAVPPEWKHVKKQTLDLLGARATQCCIRPRRRTVRCSDAGHMEFNQENTS
jgi:hypothetical protein